MSEFDGKVVVITGAASGFGEATAKRFGAEGAKVVVADVDTENAERVAGEIGDNATPVTVDVRDTKAVAAMIEAAESRFGGLDILINNAGLTRRAGPVEDSSEDDFDFTMEVNVKGVYLGIKHGVPALRRRGGGVILNTASIIALVPRKHTLQYTASKGAVVAMTKAAALELAPTIRVSCVCPVAADTNFMRGAVGGDEETYQAAREQMRATAHVGVPLGRRAEPEDVAGAFLFLASDDAKFLSGVVLPIDGGRSAGDFT